MSTSHRESVPPLSSHLHTLIDEDWEQEVLSQLPTDYEQQARQTGAFVRVGELGSVGDLLRGLLAYVVCASSFRQVGAWAVLIGLANLSHVAWHKRLRKARGFLLWLLTQQLRVVPSAVWHPMGITRVVLIDATRLKRPGGSGDDVRVHLGYDLLAGQLVDVQVSDGHTAEGFTLFGVQPTDLLVADRGYCRRGQLAHARRAGAQVVVRLAVHQVPLLDQGGQSIDVQAWLQQHGSGQHSRWVAFEQDGCCVWGRLLACSLSQDKAERARAKERKKASKQQREVKVETLYLCGWLLLFTTLPREQWSDREVLELYRARWQIELVIKRMKQVLKLAQLRGKTTCTNEATVLAILVAWTLLQTEVAQARCWLTQAVQQSSRWTQTTAGATRVLEEQTVSSWTVTALSVQTLHVLVQGYWTFARLRACLPFLARYTCSRHHRGHQESSIRRHLLDHVEQHVLDASLIFSCSSA